MTELTKIALQPETQLTGGWQLTAPLAVNKDTYDPIEILATATVAYTDGDESADRTISPQMTLPELDLDSFGEIELVDTVSYTSGTNYITGHSISYPSDPSNPIQSDDLILITTATWSDLLPGAPTTPGGYTSRFSEKDGSDDYSVRQTLFYKTATGSESGSVSLTLSTAAPMNAVMEIWRGVDTSSPFDVTEPAAVHAYTDPNPNGITTVTDRCVVRAVASGREWGGDPNARPPAGYSTAINQEPQARQGIISTYRRVETAGFEDPGAFTYDNQGSTATVSVLRPAAMNDNPTLVLVTLVTDETETAAPAASDVQLAGVNEVQVLTNTSTSSFTFTLDFESNTTSSLNHDATAAQVETALEGLATVSSGEVRCEGGPLDEAPISVEFIGARAASGQQDLSPSSGNITRSTPISGQASANFFAEGDLNTPRTGGSLSPQVFVWSLSSLAYTYTSGRPLNIDVSDHDGNKTWAAILLVFSNGDLADIVDAFGTEDSDSGATSEITTITPAVYGSRVVGVLAKNIVTGIYFNRIGATVPAATVSAGQAVSDAASLDLYITPPVPASALTIGSASWSAVENFTVGGFELRAPTTSSTTTDLADVVGDASESEYIDVASAAGRLHEVIEFDLDALPADAWIAGAWAVVRHKSSTAAPLIVQPVAINVAGDSITAPASEQPISASPAGSVVESTTQRWTELGDGTKWSDHSRLGVRIQSTVSPPGLEFHEIYTVQLCLDIVTGGPLISNLVGPTTAGDPITWDYSSASGFPQAQYFVRLMDGLLGDPATAEPADHPLEPGAGEIIYDSGWVSDAEARSHTLTDFPMHRGDITVAVKARARIDGSLVESAWATDGFQIAGAAPDQPTVNTAPYFDETDGTVRMTFDIGSDTTRAWLFRSLDSGGTWSLCETNPHAIGPGPDTAQEVYDDHAPLADGTLWHVSVDDGNMTETSGGRQMNGGGGLSITPSHWYLMAPGQPDLNAQISVAAVDIERPRESLEVQSAAGAVVASSAELGTRITLVIRTLDPTQRAELDALLALTTPLRLTDILGREWFVRPVNSRQDSFLRVGPRAGVDEHNLRDAHEITVEFVEVSYP